MIGRAYTPATVAEFYDAALFSTTAPLWTFPVVSVLLIASMFQDDLDGPDSDMSFNELYTIFVGWLLVISLASLVQFSYLAALEEYALLVTGDPQFVPEED